MGGFGVAGGLTRNGADFSSYFIYFSRIDRGSKQCYYLRLKKLFCVFGGNVDAEGTDA